VGNYQRLIKFSQGADLMIHDAQYTDALYLYAPTPRQGWGHSTWRMAIEAANAAKVKQLALYHHEPEHDDETLEDIEKRAKQVRADTFLAREGITVEL
jgi:ribonuclease BN (tRNA processing enzyme)